ncbi:P-loop containing nucleoside triphosphate hydrolase protein [Podospora appendiculata]|uniref:P-loop containing nucleoside triphosphate hydrolase protein n=1 Tax=Podospora appendiculata TaxID=314037 RepID=A0AAE1C7Y8_9PEZI|nr:P-loop containing nucleoside triphosphate hydrolase protein [Podospora appendiculata]
MNGPTFHAGLAGQNVIAAPHAADGGTINLHFNNQPPGPSATPRPFSTVPFRPDPDFVERPDITAWLRKHCSQPPSRVALVGLGGIGKSQLAIQYAYEERRSSPSTFVFWVHASTKDRFREAYREIAHRLQLPGHDDPKTDALRLVFNWLCDENNGQWLMVLDNADDIDVFYPKRGTGQSTGAKPLAFFLPQTDNGRILVTSRSRDAAARLTGSTQDVLAIQVMNDSQAQQLLRKKLGDKYEEGAAADLLRAFECLPLAITQAGAYILQRWPEESLSTYLVKFRRGKKNKAGLLGRDLGDLRRDPSASNSVAQTWQITFDQIRQEKQSAADLLMFMSQFNPQGIPRWVLESDRRHWRGIDGSWAGNSWDDGDDRNDDFEDDLHILRQYSLVAVTMQKGEYEMHALVQFCTRAWLLLSDDEQKWKRRFLQVMAREYPAGTYENWTKCQQLDPHIEHVVKEKPTAQEDIKKWAQLLTNIGWYRAEAGIYGVAEQMNRRALDGREEVLGLEHPDTLRSVSSLASVLRDQGKYEEAEQMNRRALGGREKVLGLEYPDTLTSISNLASVLQDQGKFEDAEQMNRRALGGREKVLGPEHPWTLTSVSNLASVLQGQGKYEEAEQMNRRALGGKEKVLGLEHPWTLTSVSNLASVLQGQGKYEEAEQMNRRALGGYEKVLGLEHPGTLTSVSNLASVLQDQGKYEEAEQMNRRALGGYEKVFGLEHPDTLKSVSNLASVLWRQGKYEEAEQRNQRALGGKEKVLGLEHPDTLTNPI